MNLEDLIKCVTNFEERNNMSICVSFFSDGSFVINEFWDDEKLDSFIKIDDLINYLNKIELKKDINGRCLSPIKMI